MTEPSTITIEDVPAKADQCVIAWIDGGTTESAFTESMALSALNLGWPRGPIAGIIHLISSPRIAENRCKVVEQFLSNPAFQGVMWLLMVDSDMTFTRHDIMRIMATASVDERPIVGGLCFAGGLSTPPYPTVYEITRDPGQAPHVAPVSEFPLDAPFKVGGTGAAFLLMHRGALRLMYEQFKTLPNGKPNAYPWFVEGHVDADGTPLGEDIAFCIRAQACGISVWIDPLVRIGHVKPHVLDYDLWEKSRP